MNGQSESKRLRIRNLRTAAGVALLCIAGLAYVAPVSAADGDAVVSLRGLSKAFKDVAAKVSPSVVTIQVERELDRETMARGIPPDMFRGTPFEDFFRDFQPGPQEAPRFRPKARGQGSGIIMTRDGYILTNNHVVEDASKVEVTLKDGDPYEAEIVGRDEKTDVAVIKIDASDLPAADFGDSDVVEQGDWAVAIGSPFHLDYTVTVGVISAKNRTNVSRVHRYEDFLQTDASINPGNSGGPLCNIDGEVIGVNTMIAGMNTGIGFAISANMARSVADQIIEHGEVKRPYIGVGIEPMRPDLRELIEGVEHGALVNQVYEGSPAAKAGLEPYDVIVKAGDTEIRAADDLVRYVIAQPIGATIPLVVIRDGKSIETKVTTEEMPVDFGEFRRGTDAGPLGTSALDDLGLELRDLTEEAAGQLGYRGEGVLVGPVQPGSPAAEAGMLEGDVIREVLRRKVRTVEEAADLLKSADPGRGILLRVWRDGNTFFRVLKAEPGQE